MENHIYHWVMEEKVSPQLVSKETGYSVATIRGIIKEMGGKPPSRFTHTAIKPAGYPQNRKVKADSWHSCLWVYL